MLSTIIKVLFTLGVGNEFYFLEVVVVLVFLLLWGWVVLENDALLEAVVIFNYGFHLRYGGFECKHIVEWGIEV